MRTQSYKTQREQPRRPQTLTFAAFATRKEIDLAIYRFGIARRKKTFFLPGPFMQMLAAALRRHGWNLPRVENTLYPCDYKTVRLFVSVAKKFKLLPLA